MQLKAIGLLAAACSLVAVPVSAQAESKNELTVLAGISLLDVTGHDLAGIQRRQSTTRESIFPGLRNRTTSLDDSADFGVRYGRDITDRLAVEADFSMAPGHELRDHIGFGCAPTLFCIAAGTELFVPDILTTERVIAYHYGGGIRVDLTESDIRPALVAGVGGVTYSGDDFRETNVTLRLGGALRASFGSINARAEVVDVVVANHFVTRRVEHDVHVRVGFGVRW